VRSQRISGQLFDRDISNEPLYVAKKYEDSGKGFVVRGGWGSLHETGTDHCVRCGRICTKRNY